MAATDDLEAWLEGRRFATILADPPWQFQNSTGKIAPEHRRLAESLQEVPIASEIREWRPGSFTKNFSWGKERGLRELHQVIRVGFDGKMTDVPRALFRRRVQRSGRPDFIPLNFFLFNRPLTETDKAIQSLALERYRFSDLPLMFHPAAVRASAVDTPCGAVRATGERRSWSGLRSRAPVAVSVAA